MVRLSGAIYAGVCRPLISRRATEVISTTYVLYDCVMFTERGGLMSVAVSSISRVRLGATFGGTVVTQIQ